MSLVIAPAKTSNFANLPISRAFFRKTGKDFMNLPDPAHLTTLPHALAKVQVFRFHIQVQQYRKDPQFQSDNPRNPKAHQMLALKLRMLRNVALTFDPMRNAI